MALNIILGYKTQNRLETPFLVYAGQNGDEAEAAAQKAAAVGYVRFERCVEPLRFPYVPPPRKSVSIDADGIHSNADISQLKPKSKASK